MTDHSEDCTDCDGSGFFTVWFESEGQSEYNCPCRDAVIAFELCDECAKALKEAR